MPSFDITADEIAMILIIVGLVVLPSRLSAMGDFLGRLFSKTKI